AAKRIHFTASLSLCTTPRPWWCMTPRSYCATALPSLASRRQAAAERSAGIFLLMQSSASWLNPHGSGDTVVRARIDLAIDDPVELVGTHDQSSAGHQAQGDTAVAAERVFHPIRLRRTSPDGVFTPYKLQNSGGRRGTVP